MVLPPNKLAFTVNTASALNVYKPYYRIMLGHADV